MHRCSHPAGDLVRVVDDGIASGHTVRSLANARPGASAVADIVLDDRGNGAVDLANPDQVCVGAGHVAVDLSDALALAGREVPGLPRMPVPIGAAVTSGLHAAGLATPPLCDAVRTWTGVLVDRGRADVITLRRGHDDAVLDAVLAAHGRLGVAVSLGLKTRPLTEVEPRSTTERWQIVRGDLVLHAARRDRICLTLTSREPDRVVLRVGRHRVTPPEQTPWVVPVLHAADAIDTLRVHACSPWRLDVTFVASSRVAASPFFAPSAVLRLTGGGDRSLLDAHLASVVGERLSACPVGVADLPVARFLGPAPADRADTWRALAHPVFAEPLGDAVRHSLLRDAGDPTLFDADGTRSDVGYAGPLPR